MNSASGGKSDAIGSLSINPAHIEVAMRDNPPNVYNTTDAVLSFRPKLFLICDLFAIWLLLQQEDINDAVAQNINTAAATIVAIQYALLKLRSLLLRATRADITNAAKAITDTSNANL
ncbi:hypothetical protein ECHJAX_0115 [Ehrlichia chaffeensis str. Jax]|nr:hypothetical protein ECHJAX_0115 [Ehrlichia chaffeensis str. Jax]